MAVVTTVSEASDSPGYTPPTAVIRRSEIDHYRIKLTGPRPRVTANTRSVG
jgi:hypothetical protein